MNEITVGAAPMDGFGPAQVPMTVPEPSLHGMITRALHDPSFDLNKFDRAIVILERLEAQQAEQRFDDAMALAQAEMNTIVANRDNSQTKSKYADFAQINRAIRPIYTKHGFSLSFDTGEGAPEGGWIRILCYVAAKGHRRTYHKDMPADGKGAKGGDVMTKTHAVGSADTYGRRYLVVGIFNLAIGLEEDDDGNAAGASEFLTEPQAQTLRDMIARGWPDDPEYIEKFCGYLTKLAKQDIAALTQLPGKYFEQAVIALNSAERKRAGKA